MDLLQRMISGEYEQVIAFQSAASGLRGFLAIHDTVLGPALGGIRIRRYVSEEEALNDALNLSRAMTYKVALAELPAGGGKAVLMDHDALDRDAAFEEFGVLVENLRGRFYTGPDVGIRPGDLKAARRATKYVACESSPELGDISEKTAIGCWHGIRACLDFAGIKGVPKVAVQGVGSVGMWLARLAHRAGAGLIVADVDAERAKAVEREFGARICAPEEILFAECDVLAPCALGGAVNRSTIPRIRARIICGSANNVLESREAGEMLAARGIVYAPDFLVNAGGVICGGEFHLLGVRDCGPSLERIYGRTRRVLEAAAERRVPPQQIAEEFAEARWKRPAGRPKSFRELTWSSEKGEPGYCA
jgi:leucine dehydrogenase